MTAPTEAATTPIRRRRPLLSREAAHATGIGGMLGLAATLAAHDLDDEARADIRRAATTAGDWARDLAGRIGA